MWSLSISHDAHNWNKSPVSHCQWVLAQFKFSDCITCSTIKLRVIVCSASGICFLVHRTKQTDTTQSIQLSECTSTLSSCLLIAILVLLCRYAACIHLFWKTKSSNFCNLLVFLKINLVQFSLCWHYFVSAPLNEGLLEHSVQLRTPNVSNVSRLSSVFLRSQVVASLEWIWRSQWTNCIIWITRRS